MGLSSLPRSQPHEAGVTRGRDAAEPLRRVGSKSKGSVIVSLVSDLAIAVVKIIAAVFSGSSAMTSEAIHSSVDVGNSVLLLVGERRSRRVADAAHPFGYGREIYFWTLLVAISMFAGGGALSFYEGIRHLMKPAPVDATAWSYAVLGAAGLFELVATVSAYREHRRLGGRTGLWTAFRESKDLTTFTVLFENGAALVGVVIAFVGLSASRLLRSPYPDASASLLIGVLLVVVAYFLIRESKGLLIGEGVAPRVASAMRALATENPAVEEVMELLTLQTGPNELLVLMDARFREELTSTQIVEAVGQVERALRARFPQISRVFIEADRVAAR